VIEAIARAIDRRARLLASVHSDCVRLFVGAVEGAPGITVDRYGPVLLIQSFDAPIDPEPIARTVERGLGVALTPVWNHRPAYGREGFASFHAAPDLSGAVGDEEGIRFVVDPRGAGLDPPLFLDLRSGRRVIRSIAGGATVLNLFSYTCGLGIAAKVGGAREVLNVDFAKSALAIGARNAALNELEVDLLCEDVIPIVRQLAGLPVKGRGARRPYTTIEKRSFDIVALDPPRWSKSPFGAVDVVRDYPSLLKPAMSIAARAVIATNHVPSIDRASFEAVLRRTAEKLGRAITSLEWIEPDEDVPRVDGAPPPLKIALVRFD
jgi:23S rRNA (cytosine1962-C5)-methyltransferase